MRTVGADPAPLTDPATAVYRSWRSHWWSWILATGAVDGADARFQVTSTTPLFESATMNPDTRDGLDGLHRHDPLTIGNEFLFFL